MLTIEIDGHVATLWLDRPEKRNALGPAFWSDLPRAMAAIASDPEIRVVVVAARGPHFSVGLDLVAMSALTGAGDAGNGAAAIDGRRAPGRPVLEILRLQASVTSVAECPICRSSPPSTATASAAAWTWWPPATSAWPVPMPSSRCGRPRWPSSPTWAACSGFPHIIGQGHLAELAFTGKDISAARAGPSGWSTRSAPMPSGVLNDARAMAAEIAANSPLAVQGTKAVLAAGEGRSVAEGLDYVATWNAGVSGL